MGDAYWLKRSHVVFGQVTKGIDVLKKMMKSGTKTGEPKKKLKIFDCGEVPPE